MNSSNINSSYKGPVDSSVRTDVNRVVRTRSNSINRLGRSVSKVFSGMNQVTKLAVNNLNSSNQSSNKEHSIGEKDVKPLHDTNPMKSVRFDFNEQTVKINRSISIDNVEKRNTNEKIDNSHENHEKSLNKNIETTDNIFKSMDFKDLTYNETGKVKRDFTILSSLAEGSQKKQILVEFMNENKTSLGNGELNKELYVLGMYKNNIKESDLIEIRNEIKIINFLQDKNIPNVLIGHPIKLIGNQAIGGDVGVLAPFANGGTLKECFNKGGIEISEHEFIPLTPQLRSHMYMQITEGLKSLSELGIVHRDLKPDNILIKYEKNSEGEYKINFYITDLGKASFIKHEDRYEPNKLALAYLPPGIFERKENATKEVGIEKNAEDVMFSSSTDVFSLGVTFWLDATNTKMEKFQEKVRKIKEEFPNISRQEVMDKVFFESIEWKSVPAETKEMIKTMLDKDPEKRPSLDQLLESFKSIEIPSSFKAIPIQSKPISSNQNTLSENQGNGVIKSEVYTAVDIFKSKTYE